MKDDDKYLTFYLSMSNIWNDNNYNDSYSRMRLSLTKKQMHSFVPLRHYEGVYNVFVNDVPAKVNVMLKPNFFIDDNALVKLRRLFSVDKSKSYLLKLRKEELLRCMGNQPIKEDFEKRISTRIMDNKRFTLNDKELFRFAGISKVSKKSKVFFEIENQFSFEARFNIKCIMAFEKSRTSKLDRELLPKNNNFVNFKLIRDSFEPKYVDVKTKEEYLNSNIKSKQVTLFG